MCKHISLKVTILILILSLIIVNIICYHVDLKKLDNAYGQKIEVDGHQMVAEVLGKDNPETIVILPGFGSPSPILEFKPLAAKLSSRYKVITVEPFGYGLSDGTDRERTVENIVDELHTCINKLGVTDYYLMAHSIGGAYSLYWANTYPDEVQGFIGIDPSVPKQDEVIKSANIMQTLMVNVSKNLYNLGITRLMAMLRPGSAGADYVNEINTASDIEELNMLCVDNSGSSTISNEAKNFNKNFDTIRYMTFQEDMKVLMFLSSDNCQQVSMWLTLHKDVVRNTPDSTIKQLQGGHYLHLVQLDSIYNTTCSFLKSPSYN